MTLPTYSFRIRNQHGVPAEQWTTESQSRLRALVAQAGAHIDGMGLVAVASRAQLYAAVAAIGHGCTADEYAEYDSGNRETAAIESLERYGSHGWTWTVRWREHNFESGAWDARSTTYRTGRDGDGLWMSLPNGDWKQLAGTCQYELPAGERAARRAIERGLYGK